MLRVNHPSEDILGEVNNYLDGREIVIGVTGSVALYKSVDLVRWILRRNGRVAVVLSKEAAKLVSPELFRWASGGPVYVEFGGDVEHIILARRASAAAIAPATLASISKIAYGIVDTSVTLMAVSVKGYGKPVVISPAMHGNMYATHQFREAIDKLKAMGFKIIEPEVRKGVARFPSIHFIGRTVAALARRGCEDLRGVKALVTAGPTREWIDRVRFISNPSSGAMGVEVAMELWARGAKVDLVAGHLAVEAPHAIKTYRVNTTEDMARRVEELTSATRYDVIIGAGAPVDFRPERSFKGKLKSGQSVSIRLEPTPKVLESVVKPPKALVAFAAEHVENLEELEVKALEKLEKYSADFIVANRVGLEGVGFASPHLEAILVDKKGVKKLGKVHKEVVAAFIADKVAEILGAEGCGAQKGQYRGRG